MSTPFDTSPRSPEARAEQTRLEAARPQPSGLIRRFLRLFSDFWRKADRDRILGLAGENAFMGVLTVFPTLLLFAAVLGQLSAVIGEDNTVKVKEAVTNFLQEVLTSSAAGVDETVNQLFDASTNTLTLALVVALMSVAQAFASVLNTVTLAYDVRDHRGWWRRRFIGLWLGVGSVFTGAIMITALVIGPLFGSAAEVVSSLGIGEEYAFVWSYIRFPVAFLALVAWATTLFHICPGRPARWRSGLPGAVVTALSWLLASLAFSTYLTLVIPASPVLGALGGGLILMTWLYLLCLGLLIGAEFNATLLARRVASVAHAEPLEQEPPHDGGVGLPTRSLHHPADQSTDGG